MRQTLFFIPHEVGGLELFGFGSLLVVWLVLGAGWIWWLARRGGASAVIGFVPFLAVVAFAIAIVFPLLEAQDPSGRRLGLPIRGYGTFVLVGFGSGVWWAIQRARRWGIGAEMISSLAVWMFVAGFIGARLFFVIEYWEEFRRGTWWATLVETIRITEGGLVVYGALIAALPALVIFCYRHALSPLVLGDVVAPALAIGLAFGRLGCLMNGCCYGGVCEQGPIGMQFPRYNSVVQRSVSPPYQHQHSTGQLHGFVLGAEPGTRAPVVRSVAVDSPAARAGLTAGSRITAIDRKPAVELEQAMRALAAAGPEVTVETAEGRTIRWSVGSLPSRSLPVHPVQVYSAMNALLLCLVLVASEPYLRRTGSVLALMLTLYPPLRILEEIIRVDEPGQFGTGLTISQLISLGMLMLASGLWAFLYWRSPATEPHTAERDPGVSVA